MKTSEELWGNICDLGAAPGLADEQRAELDRRLADHRGNPNDVESWDEVKAAAMMRIGG